MLNNTEREIVRLMADGLNSKEIGELMKYTQTSIESMRMKIIRKLELKNSCHLIAWAARNGVLDPVNKPTVDNGTNQRSISA